MEKIKLQKALEESYSALAPFSKPARWEFNSHLSHLEHIIVLLEKMPKQSTILDVGCHIGILPLALRILGFSVSGNDKYVFKAKDAGNMYGFTSEEIQDLQRIWRKYNVSIEELDVAESISPKQYDLVLSIATIEHQPYPKPFLENIINFVKDGGYLYIATPNVVKLANRFRFMLGRPPMANIEEFYSNPYTFNKHWREYTVGEVVSMGMMSGLKIHWAKAQQIEPVNFSFQNRKKWLASIARFLAQFIPGTGDSVVVLFKKEKRQV